MSHPANILLIDDDVLIQVMVEDVVSQMGHHFECAADGDAARKALGEDRFDLVILDRRLPDTDGLLLAETIQKEAQAPFIVLSSLNTANDQVLGLGMGASDYICKPVEPAVLRARIDKHVGVRRGQAGEPVVSVGDALRLNRTTRRLWVGDRVEVLSPAETRLLIGLVEEFDRPLDRMQLSKAIGGREWVYGDRTVDVLVSRVRRRLRDSGMQIVTVHGVGYMLTHDGAKT